MTEIKVERRTYTSQQATGNGRFPKRDDVPTKKTNPKLEFEN